LTIPIMLYSMNAIEKVPTRHWMVRSIAFHVLAASVLAVAAVATIIGSLLGASMFDPRPFVASRVRVSPTECTAASLKRVSAQV
jgi:hypothetical protein